MEYTVKMLSRIAGVSPRTLRYYDEIGLLRPGRINSSGYRVYGAKEVDTLQQILFYRELGLKLNDIKAILNDRDYDEKQALKKHLARLQAKKRQIETLISNVKKTIAAKEGSISMTDEEKFAGFKERLIEENERKYGKEAREKYGDEAVERSNEAFRSMSKEKYEQYAALDKQIKQTLAQAMRSGDPAGPLAQKAAELHKEWLTMSWGSYDPQAHAGVAQMYVDDERFRQYYDKEQPGSAAFLRDAIFIFTKR